MMSKEEFNLAEKYVCLYKTSVTNYIYRLELVTKAPYKFDSTNPIYHRNYWGDDDTEAHETIFANMIICIFKEENGIIEKVKNEYAEYLI